MTKLNKASDRFGTLNQKIWTVKNWKTAVQNKKIIYLMWFKVILFSLWVIGFYLQSLEKLVRMHFVKAVLIWSSFLIFGVLLSNVQTEMHIIQQTVIQAQSASTLNYYNNFVFYTGGYNLVAIDHYLTHQPQVISGLNQLFTTQLANQSLIQTIITNYLHWTINLKVVFSFMIICLVILVAALWSFLRFWFLKSSLTTKQKILVGFDLLLNPLGPIFSQWKLHAWNVKYYVRINLSGEINLWKEIITALKLMVLKIYFWFQKKAIQKNFNFDFPQSGYDIDKFIEIKNLSFSYHESRNWQKIEHKFLQLFSQKKYHDHMIKKNSLYHENKIHEKKSYTPVLDNINLKIAKHKFTTILGANGSGKSTLANIIINQLKHYSGTISWGNQNLKYISLKDFAQNVSMISQTNDLEKGVKVYDFVAYGRSPYLKMMGTLSPDDHLIVQKAMQTTNIMNLSNKMTNELSGGQAQKVLIAMALAQNTDTIILDEPTTYLDIKNQYELLDHLKAMYNNKKTVIAILHDINQAIHYSDELILLKDGKIYAQGHPKDVINFSNLQAVFGLSAKLIEKNGRNYIANLESQETTII